VLWSFHDAYVVLLGGVVNAFGTLPEDICLTLVAIPVGGSYLDGGTDSDRW